MKQNQHSNWIINAIKKREKRSSWSCFKEANEVISTTTKAIDD